MKRALVLNSGGLDSTTCLALAIEQYGCNQVSTLSIYYGQKHQKELECAKKIAAHYGIAHHELDLSHIMAYDNSPLLSKSDQAIPQQSYGQQLQEDKTGIVKTYVPFRNGLFLSAAAAIAMSLNREGETDLFLGAHADDAAGSAYADCTEEFTQTMGKAIELGTYNKVHLITPLVAMNKAQVVKIGLQLAAPYQYTWSCYEGGDRPCGQCATCLDRQRAFAAHNVTDPALINPK
jgi:7-cyano-7-deazaguanine synthase